MHDRLFQNQRTLVPLSPHAEALGLDVAKFDECMNSGKHAKAIRADMEQAQKIGVTGTPGFVIAVTDSEDPTKAKGMTFLSGAKPFASFKAEIDKALNQTK